MATATPISAWAKRQDAVAGPDRVGSRHALQRQRHAFTMKSLSESLKPGAGPPSARRRSRPRAASSRRRAHFRDEIEMRDGLLGLDQPPAMVARMCRAAPRGARRPGRAPSPAAPMSRTPSGAARGRSAAAAAWRDRPRRCGHADRSPKPRQIDAALGRQPAGQRRQTVPPPCLRRAVVRSGVRTSKNGSSVIGRERRFRRAIDGLERGRLAAGSRRAPAGGGAALARSTRRRRRWRPLAAAPPSPEITATTAPTGATSPTCTDLGQHAGVIEAPPSTPCRSRSRTGCRPAARRRRRP